MHILILPSWYSTPANPVRGSFFREQGLALQKAGHRVGFLVPPAKLRSRHGLAEVRDNWRRRPDSVAVSEDQGMPTYRVPWWGAPGSLVPWLRQRLMQSVFERYCADNGRPDILHGHSILYGGYFAVYLGRRNGIPSVLTEHSSNYVNAEILFPQQWFVRHALQHVDRAFAVSPRLASALQAYAPERTVDVLPNMVDTHWFCPPAAEPAPRPFRFVAVGALRRLKGHQLLIRAFAEEFRGEDAVLQIAGEGNARAELEQLIDRLQIGEQVALLGMLPRDDVRALLQQSHALVSGSFSENNPVSMLEALACGKPIVATRSNGPEYFVDETLGILTPRGEVAGLALAMRTMFRDYAAYDRQAIRETCVSRFSEATIVGALEATYERLAGTGL